MRDPTQNTPTPQQFRYPATFGVPSFFDVSLSISPHLYYNQFHLTGLQHTIRDLSAICSPEIESLIISLTITECQTAVWLVACVNLLIKLNFKNTFNILQSGFFQLMTELIIT